MKLQNKRKAMLAAAQRMLRRSRSRRDFAQMSSVADEVFTAIVSVNHRDNILPAIKMAENLGLEATVYAQCKIAVTGKRDTVLKYQATLRQKLFGEDLQDQTIKSLSHDLIAMSHDLPVGRLKMRAQMAASELSSLHPVSTVRMRQHRQLALSIAKETGYAMGWKTNAYTTGGVVIGALGGGIPGAVIGGIASYLTARGVEAVFDPRTEEVTAHPKNEKQMEEVKKAAAKHKATVKPKGTKKGSDLRAAHQAHLKFLTESGHKQVGHSIEGKGGHIANMEDEKGQKYNFITTKDHESGEHVMLQDGSGHWDESKHPRDHGKFK